MGHEGRPVEKEGREGGRGGEDEEEEEEGRDAVREKEEGGG